MTDYSTATETAALIQTATPEQQWLQAQLERIDPHCLEQGHDGAYTRALEALVIELKVKPVQEPVAWADDAAIQGRIGDVCSTSAKRYWENSDWVDRKKAERHKHPLYAAPVQPAASDALLHLAFAGHATPQHMLPDGVTLFDNDGVLVKLPDGRVVTAGRVPDHAVKYAARKGGAG